MNRILRRLKREDSGQGLVEFALILPLLLLVSFGIIEVGRLLFIYTSVSAASREAARYAAASGIAESGEVYYLDTVGIEDAANRIATLTGGVTTITYDHGPGTGTFTPSVPTDVILGDRIVVRVDAPYSPMLGLTALGPFTVSSTTARTILKEISILGNPAGGTALVVQITSPSPNTYFDEGTDITFTAVAAGGTPAYHSWSWTSSMNGSIGSSDSFTTNSLNVGNHVITVRVSDSALPTNATATAQIVINIRGKPVLTILEPSNGEHFQFGLPITFEATAIDAEDGNITDNIIWKYADGTVMGTGGLLSINGWAVGPHMVTAEVTDTSLIFVQKSVSFSVDPDLPPTVTITSPDDGKRFDPDTQSGGEPAAEVTFTGTAIDLVSGDLSGGIQWIANGISIGTGASATTVLTVGTYEIEARAYDDPPEPDLGTDNIVIYVSPNDPPEVHIYQPTEADTYTKYEKKLISFKATAEGWNGSSQGADLKSSLEWWDYSTTPRTFLFGGAEMNKADLSIGTHIIRAIAKDANGVTAWDTITVTIAEDPPPIVTITSPTKTSFYVGDPIRFSALATDVPDGDRSGTLVWTSSLMSGNIGTGATFTTTNLVAGTHLITASATDSAGKIGTATKSIQVKALVCPTPATTIIETISVNPIRATYAWHMTMPSPGMGLLLSTSISWRGGTLNYINWAGGPVNLFTGSVVAPTNTTITQAANVNLPVEYSWSGVTDLLYLFSNEPANNSLVILNATFRGPTGGTCTYTAQYIP